MFFSDFATFRFIMSFSPMHSDHGSECKARGAVCEGIFWKSSFFLGKPGLFGDRNQESVICVQSWQHGNRQVLLENGPKLCQLGFG